MDSDIYFGTLQSLRAHASKLRKKDDAEEKRLVDYLPVNERIEIERENKVLTKWQERQRDWERIEQRINKKLSSKVARPLMMTVTDEYRSKMEEYDLIQASIPLKERYGESAWQMTLRGGGPITVAIGHIFSGLECEIDPHVPKPKMVRKPKPSTAVWKNDTFLEESENLTSKRKKYEKHMQEIRPHTMTYRDAGNLVVRSVDLFQWAEESSLEYVNKKREEELARLEEEMEAIRSLEASHHSEELTKPDHPQLVFLSQTEVVLETQIGKRVHQTVSFKNTGPVVLYYRWKKMSGGKRNYQDKNGSKSKSLDSILDVKGVHDSELRAHVLEKQRDKFFCFRDCGEILPSEVISTEFVFDSDIGGVYRSNWILQFIPEETKITVSDIGEESEQNSVHFSDERSEKAGSQVSSYSKALSGSLGITLRGHCVIPDESMTNRSYLSSHITYQTEVTEIQDIIYAIVRRVRDPIRLSDLLARQRDLFSTHNEAVYQSFFPQTSKRIFAPWKITNDRIERLEKLQKRVSSLFEELQGRYFSTWNEVCEPDNPSIADLVSPPTSLEKLDWQNYTIISERNRECILQSLFPEQSLDIFDEVSLADIEPRWNYDVSSALRTLNNLSHAAHNLVQLEEVLLLRAKTEQKLQAKLARKAAKKAAGDSDEEDEEEEEEEEDDDEELKRKQRKPQHYLAVEVQRLKDAIEGELLALQTTLTYSADTVYSFTREALCDAIDSICDAQEGALQAANLIELVNYTLGPASQSTNEFSGFVNSSVIAPMVNPFLSDEGRKAFDSLIVLTSPEPLVDPNAPPVKGKKEPPKKGKEVAPLPATQLQVDYYHKIFYEQLRNRIIDSIIDKVDITPSATNFDSDATNENSIVKNVIQAGVWRDEDITNKVILYTFDLSQVVNRDANEASIGVGFDVVARKIAIVAEEVSKMILNGQPLCLLLLSSSCAAPEESVSSTRAADLAQHLQFQWDKQVSLYRKQMKRAKQAIPSTHISNKSLQIVNFVNSFTSLMYELLPPVLQHPQEDTIPIFIIPDLNASTLIPPAPVYEMEDDDDNDPVVAIGTDAYNALQYQQFLAAYPVRIPVTIPGSGPKSLIRQRSNLARRASFQRQSTDSPTCFCDVSAALVDLVQYICVQFFQSNRQAVQWIDGTTQHLFQPQLPLFKVYDASYKKIMPRDPVQLALMKLSAGSVLCSQRTREALIWSLLPRFLMPSWSYFLSTSVSEVSNNSSSSLFLKEHVRQMFLAAVAEQRRPRTVFVLGGIMRAEKLRLLDELIPLFPVIYLVGEIAVRFLNIESSNSTSLNSNVNERASRFEAACRRLVAKARVMGCELILPIDFVVGEDRQDRAAVQAKLFYHDPAFSGPLPPPLFGIEESKSNAASQQKQRAEMSAAGLTRSDAVEYDGDTKIVSAVDLLALSKPILLPPFPPTMENSEEGEAAAMSAKKRSNDPLASISLDAVYDIGPVSQQRLKEAVEQSELAYIYGTAGFVELSAFQGGHNAIVQALATIFSKENATAEARKAQRKEAAKIEGKNSVAATQAAYAAMQPIWLERAQHVVLLGEDTVDWFGRLLDPDADYLGDLVASGHASYADANSSLFFGCMVTTELPAVTVPTAISNSDKRHVHAFLEETLLTRPPMKTEFVYSRAKNLDEEDDDDEDEEDEDEEDD